MPTVPIPSGPSVRVDSSPLRIAPPPNGVQVLAEGLGAIGRSAREVSDTFSRHAEAQAAIDNKAAVDGATVGLAQDLGRISDDFANNNKGIAAEQNLPSTFEALEKARAAHAETLASPAARDMFNTQSRIATLQTTQSLARFASTEKKDYNTKQIEGKVGLLAMGQTPENFDVVQDQINQQLAVLATPQLQGWSPEEYQLKVAEARGRSAYNITAGLAPNDPAKAQEFYTAHKDALNPAQRTQAESLIRASSENKTVSSVADEYTAHAARSTPGAAAGVDALVALGARVTSGLRTPEHNAAVGGVPGSHHLTDTARDLVPPKGMTMAQLAAQAATLMPGAKVINEGDHVHVQWDAPRSEGDALDNLETHASAGYAAIASDPRLHGDPVLIDRAQSRYLTNINQARALNNLSTGAARERLQGAALSGGITDPVALQTAYPGALGDWNALSASAQRQLTTQLTVAGNAPTPERDTNYRGWLGRLMNPSTASAAAHESLGATDLTRSQSNELFKLQQKVLAKDQALAAKQANLSKALANPYVKAGASKLNDDDYHVFTGALNGALDSWAESHPGKQPSAMEVGQLANTLLAERTAKGTRSVLGVELPTTFKRPGFEVPEYVSDNITIKFTKRFGRAPTPAEVAYIYHGAK